MRRKNTHFLGFYRIQILSLMDCLTSGKLLNLIGPIGREKVGLRMGMGVEWGKDGLEDKI